MTTQVHACHILVKTKEEAEKIYQELNFGGDFKMIARQKSICPSGKNGGDLGWFGKGQMVKEFEQAAFALKKGGVSKPIQTEFGWHIIWVIESW